MNEDFACELQYETSMSEQFRFNILSNWTNAVVKLKLLSNNTQIYMVYLNGT